MAERISKQCLLHVVAVMLMGLAHETVQIRVDFNTNTGPIVPPTTTVRPVPQPPFKDPAPVWEDHSQDIPNPNPYIYVPPPPSRPRYNNVNFEFTNSINDSSQPRRYDVFHPPTQPLPYHPVSQVLGYPHYQQQSRYTNTPVVVSVPSLSVQYVPNVGWRYYAVVVPQNFNIQPIAQSSKQVDKYAFAHEKLNGKYNPKLKKYKAYEKKYQPVPSKKYELTTAATIAQANQFAPSVSASSPVSSVGTTSTTVRNTQ